MKWRGMVVNKIISGWGAVAGWLVLAGTLSLGLAQTNHTVETGQTLDSIGKQYGVSPRAIASENKLANPDRIYAGMVLAIPESTNAPRRYAVKSGDTLGSIAQAHGTTVAALSELNKIEDPKLIRAGQELRIPTGGAVSRPPAVARHPLPPELKRSLDSTRVTPGKWRYVVIHHSATRNGSLDSIDMYHRRSRRMENGAAYHFVICNGNGKPDGTIEVGNRWKRQIKGGHLASDDLNEVAIGICLIGNFEVDQPTAAQMKSLYALVSYLNNRCNIPKSRVQSHTQINTRPTACPGKRFPMTTLRENL